MPPLSSGFAVSSTLQNILNRKKADQRQAMIDELSRKKIESGISVDEENARGLAANREMLNTVREGQMINDFGKQHTMGDDLSTVDPMFLRVLQKHGMISESPLKLQPQVTTSEAPQTGGAPTPEQLDAMAANAPHPEAKKGTYFSGMPEQVEEERRRSDLGGLISRGIFSDTSDMSPSERMVALAQAMGDKNVPSSVYSSMEPQGNLYVTDEASGKTSAQLGPDGKPIHTGRQGNVFQVRNRPPQGGQPQAFSHTGPNGETIWSWIRPGENIPTDSHRGNPAAPVRQGDLLPPAIANQLAKFKTAARPSMFTTKAQSDRFKTYGDTALTMASRRVSDPSVITAIQQIRNNPNEKRPNDQIIKDIAADPNVKPDELADFTELLYLVRH